MCSAALISSQGGRDDTNYFNFFNFPLDMRGKQTLSHGIYSLFKVKALRTKMDAAEKETLHLKSQEIEHHACTCTAIVHYCM